jgi:hypothetical protein
MKILNKELNKEKKKAKKIFKINYNFLKKKIIFSDINKKNLIL